VGRRTFSHFVVTDDTTNKPIADSRLRPRSAVLSLLMGPFEYTSRRQIRPAPCRVTYGTRMGVNATGTLGIADRVPKTRESRRRRRRGGWDLGGCAPFQKIYEFFISKWCDMVHSGCVVCKIHLSHGLYLYDKLYRSTSLCLTNDTDRQIHVSTN